MIEFTSSEKCESRKHCTFCRMSETWRHEHGAPIECPFGVTADSAMKHQSALVKIKPGLGDMVKAGLSAIGITEERVSKVLGRPCGCSKRAEALNELGRRIGIG